MYSRTNLKKCSPCPMHSSRSIGLLYGKIEPYRYTMIIKMKLLKILVCANKSTAENQECDLGVDGSTTLGTGLANRWRTTRPQLGGGTGGEVWCMSPWSATLSIEDGCRQGKARQGAIEKRKQSFLMLNRRHS